MCTFNRLFLIILALNNHSTLKSMCQIGLSEENEWNKMSSPPDHNNLHRHPATDESLQRHHDMKYFVDLYTAALHLRYVSI